MTSTNVWHFAGFRIVRAKRHGHHVFTLYRRRNDPDPWQREWVWSGTYDTWGDAVRDMTALR